MSTTALAVRETGAIQRAEDAPRPVRLLRPAAAPQEMLAIQEETRVMITQILQDGRDYGKIPGTDKPSMLKPGAERTALAFGCYYGDPEIIEKEIDHDRVNHFTKVKWVKEEKPENWKALRDQGLGRNRQYDGVWQWQRKEVEDGTSFGLYRYVIRVHVIDRATGERVGFGIGACSTMESKYIDRPRDAENTALKMAHKRAIVGACLVTFGLSDQFTQDVEEPHLRGEPARDDVDGGGTGDDAHGTTEPKPVCPVCKSAMWDNRARNAERLTKGEKPMPEWKCKSKECDGKYWPGQWPPAPEATDEMKERIRALLVNADLSEKKKAATLKLVEATDKPLAAKRALEIIDGLEQLQDAGDDTQAEMPLEGAARPATAKPDPVRATPADTARALNKNAAKADTAGRAKAEQLIAHPKFTDDERAFWRKKLAAADSLTALDLLLEDLEQETQLPF